MEQQPQVIVRTAVRHDLCLPGIVLPLSEGAGGVKFAPLAGTKDGAFEVDVVDLGTGGVGFISMLFLPRRSLVNLRVRGPGESAAFILDIQVRLHRVHMTDRRPAYLMGGSFEALTAESKLQLDNLLASLAGEAG